MRTNWSKYSLRNHSLYSWIVYAHWLCQMALQCIHRVPKMFWMLFYEHLLFIQEFASIQILNRFLSTPWHHEDSQTFPLEAVEDIDFYCFLIQSSVINTELKAAIFLGHEQYRCTIQRLGRSDKLMFKEVSICFLASSSSSGLNLYSDWWIGSHNLLNRF